jgi:predicted Zn-dependent protease with MMP-like domain
MIRVDLERFESLVADALDEIPEALAQLMDNVVVVVEDDPEEPGLLGLYEGTPLTEREAYGWMDLPDRITIYRNPICESASSAEEVVDEVLTTVVHEIAHHFGIDDDVLHDLGWG